MSTRRKTIIVATSWLVAGWASAAPALAADDAAARFFEDKVRPTLADRCYECHGPASGKGKAKLRVDSREALLRGGESGPAIVPGEPDRSLLLLAIRHDGAVAMPPKSRLDQAEIDAIAAWVKAGAPWPSESGARADAATPAGGLAGWGKEARAFWAFQPLTSPSLPGVADPKWARSPIDRFILARLEAAGLHPSPPADRRTLIRRATIDLIGLPPMPEEVEAFVRDASADAFDRVLDRLLASPHYGERWGRHWLDVARYADSNGMDDNLAYSDAWRYRDYVIASFNADEPFPRFLEAQLAGDILAGSDPKRRDERVVATGFLAIGPKMLAEDDPVKQQMDIVDEQLDTTCRTFLGLTMGCARCHDHKFDPLAMADYYALAGIFKSTRTMLSFRVDSKWNATGLETAQAALRLEDLETIIDRHDNALVNGNTNAMPAEERAARARLLEDAKAEYARIPKAMSVAEGSVGDVPVFLRGNHLTPGPVVRRGFPTILAGSDQAPLPSSQSGRLELARWLGSPTNPLTARVLVNRVWRWHFGRGIVPSADNFGRLGQVPSHPELLDWLATRFIADGWSIKALHRRILLSQTYQMSTSWDEKAAQVDPEDRLFWRMRRSRLDAETLRDAILAVCGLLDPASGGPPMASKPFQNLTATGDASRPTLYESRRRSVYLPILRGALYDQFQAFDFPDPAVANGDRVATTVASQSLFLMNGPLMKSAPAQLARALLDRAGIADEDRLRDLCLRLFARPAGEDELRGWEAFLRRYQDARSLASEKPEDRRNLAWQGLCRALMSSNEFLYIE
ncbi:PSD1 and planctomycete cytochrome C domain-containing protein [Aquisphaera insulae]|uniref:PSD1 and planctomycete cytochrome C domain-containing protein n=1 Tax=Aquisphaera insulae TaxID=2712864 RepID=UPI0013ED1DE5|nr:PSD1 and planctomycete cytochrome C domain-containing protein [Aquisphaera insulae]